MPNRSKEAEQELNQSKEISGLMWVDPADLVKNSLASTIPNWESYREMEEQFDPNIFDVVHIVWVNFASDRGMDRRLCPKDGHTRTRFAFSHREKGIPGNPNFFKKIKCIDRTSAVLGLEKHDPKATLSISQYIACVVEHTVVHKAIAPKRLAAHLITGWEGLVGNQLAKRFPALSALNLLYDPKIPLASLPQLAHFLEKQSQLITGENTRERAKIHQALLDYAQILRQSVPFRSEIVHAAFLLVAEHSPSIGGGAEARKQIYGLVCMPEVVAKLEATFPDKSGKTVQRIHEQTRLAECIGQTLVKHRDGHDFESAVMVMMQVLKDSDLDYKTTLSVLMSDQPVAKYDEARRENNMQKLRKIYTEGQNKTQLSLLEQRMIEILGRKTHLTVDSSLVESIRRANSVIEKADTLKAKIVESEEQLRKSGVNVGELNERLSLLERRKKEIINSDNPATICQKADEVSLINRSLEGVINRAVEPANKTKTPTFEIKRISDSLERNRQLREAATIFKEQLDDSKLKPSNLSAENRTILKSILDKINSLLEDTNPKTN